MSSDEEIEDVEKEESWIRAGFLLLL